MGHGDVRGDGSCDVDDVCLGEVGVAQEEEFGFNVNSYLGGFLKFINGCVVGSSCLSTSRGVNGGLVDGAFGGYGFAAGSGALLDDTVRLSDLVVTSKLCL